MLLHSSCGHVSTVVFSRSVTSTEEWLVGTGTASTGRVGTPGARDWRWPRTGQGDRATNWVSHLGHEGLKELMTEDGSGAD
jgi:hypothetical protein